MIVCPRCGFQAPDGSPWCPRCGYGCPYPLPPQQQGQMPVVYQPQQIPAQYDVYDIPPQPDQPQQEQPTPKRKKGKRKKKKRGIFKKLGIGCAIIFLLFVGFIVLVLSSGSDTDTEKKIKNSAATPQNVETMVKQMMDQTETAVQSAILSATPTFTLSPTDTPAPTNTPIPTDTPAPTNTPVPSDTPIPAAWSSGQTYSDSSYAQSGGGYLGSTVQDTSSCRIKGNINSKGEKIYHCPGWRDYDKTEIDTYKGEQWFCTEQDAINAGWRKPGNVNSSCNP